MVGLLTCHVYITWFAVGFSGVLALHFTCINPSQLDDVTRRVEATFPSVYEQAFEMQSGRLFVVSNSHVSSNDGHVSSSDGHVSSSDGHVSSNDSLLALSRTNVSLLESAKCTGTELVKSLEELRVSCNASTGH